jgi:hypothetical protein
MVSRDLPSSAARNHGATSGPRPLREVARFYIWWRRWASSRVDLSSAPHTKHFVLSDAQRARVLAERQLNGWSAGRIAELLGFSESTVTRVLSKAGMLVGVAGSLVARGALRVQRAQGLLHMEVTQRSPALLGWSILECRYRSKSRELRRSIAFSFHHHTLGHAS